MRRMLLWLAIPFALLMASPAFATPCNYKPQGSDSEAVVNALNDLCNKMDTLLAGGAGAGTGDVNIKNFGGTATTLGQKTKANSIPTVKASDSEDLDTHNSVIGQRAYLADPADGSAVSMSNPVQIYIANSYSAPITTNATTIVKSGAGTLASICINTKGAAANTATVYDNTAASGTKIVNSLDTVNAGIGCIAYNVAFATGLTIVTATGTAADLTVTYR